MIKLMYIIILTSFLMNTFQFCRNKVNEDFKKLTFYCVPKNDSITCSFNIFNLKSSNDTIVSLNFSCGCMQGTINKMIINLHYSQTGRTEAKLDKHPRISIHL